MIERGKSLHSLCRYPVADKKLQETITDILKIKQTVGIEQFNQLVAQQDQGEFTPLHYAVNANLAGVVSILLPEKQADKDCLMTIRNRNNETVLHLALQRQDKAIFALITNSISNEALFELYIKDREKLEKCAKNGGNGDAFKALIAQRIGAFLLVHYLVQRGGKKDDADFRRRLAHYKALKDYLKNHSEEKCPVADEFKVSRVKKVFLGGLTTQGYFENFNFFMSHTSPNKFDALCKAEKYFRSMVVRFFTKDEKGIELDILSSKARDSRKLNS